MHNVRRHLNNPVETLLSLTEADGRRRSGAQEARARGVRSGCACRTWVHSTGPGARAPRVRSGVGDARLRPQYKMWP